MNTTPKSKRVIATIIASFTLTLFGAPLVSAKPVKLSERQLQERAAGAADVNGLVGRIGERVRELGIPTVAVPPSDLAGFIKEITKEITGAAARNPGQGAFQSQSALVRTTGPGAATVTQSQTLSR
jgi:hypothetical protein